MASDGTRPVGSDFGFKVLSFGLLDLSKRIKSKSGGRAPRRRHTLLLAQKSMQKRACAALGMNVCMINVVSNGFCVREPARCRGPRGTAFQVRWQFVAFDL